MFPGQPTNAIEETWQTDQPQDDLEPSVANPQQKQSHMSEIEMLIVLSQGFQVLICSIKVAELTDAA